ncbi:5'-3' exonuclease, partial [Listeria innocua FSL S4-378]
LKIQEDLAMLELSQKLAKIHTEVPLEMNLASLKYNGFRDDAFAVVEKYGLKTLTRDIE